MQVHSGGDSVALGFASFFTTWELGPRQHLAGDNQP